MLYYLIVKNKAIKIILKLNFDLQDIVCWISFYNYFWIVVVLIFPGIWYHSIYFFTLLDRYDAKVAGEQNAKYASVIVYVFCLYGYMLMLVLGVFSRSRTGVFEGDPQLIPMGLFSNTKTCSFPYKCINTSGMRRSNNQNILTASHISISIYILCFKSRPFH